MAVPAPAPTLPCPVCRRAVDPLRADRVALFSWQFRYFCSAACYEQFRRSAQPEPPPHLDARESNGTRSEAEIAPSADGAVADRAAADRALADREVPARDPIDSSGEQLVPAIASSGRQAEVGREPCPSDPEAGTASTPTAETSNGVKRLTESALLAAAAIGLALLAPALPSSSPTIAYASLAFGLASATAMWMGLRSLASPSLEIPPAVAVLPASSVLACALLMVVTNDPRAAAVLLMGVALLATLAGVNALFATHRQALDRAAAALLRAASAPTRRLDPTRASPAITPVDTLHAGDEVLVEPGDALGADLLITAGQGQLLPWFGASETTEVEAGSHGVAGARLLRGRLRGLVTWTGADRTLFRLLPPSSGAAENNLSFSRIGRLFAYRIGPALALLIAPLGLLREHHRLEYVALACFAFAAFANPAVALTAALVARRGVLDLAARGIAFMDAGALERAGRVSAAVLCARGTLLLGEPEVMSIEPLGDYTQDDLLALAAGAETVAPHPNAIAVRRAARARGIAANAVRSPDYAPGLGVVAVASSGEPLYVGSRALMLKQRVSVALAETRILELEERGQSVLLVALGGRLIGLLSLADGLRPGARAAVQHLLDAGVEPVLLSGDSRETCEAVARSVDIKHVRPEVLPADRGKEIRRLADTGAVVAVIGTTPADDLALGAADVSIALGAAGGTATHLSAVLASSQVRDAALALAIARSLRQKSTAALWVPLASAVLGLGLLLLGAPLVLGPLFLLGGGLIGLRLDRAPGSSTSPHR